MNNMMDQVVARHELDGMERERNVSVLPFFLQFFLPKCLGRFCKRWLDLLLLRLAQIDLQIPKLI